MFHDPLSELISTGVRCKRSRGQAIQMFDDDTKINLLTSGYIKRYLISKDGSLSTQSIFGPGQTFPMTAVFRQLLGDKDGPQIVHYYYQAVTDIEYFSLPTTKLADVVKTEPRIYLELLRQAGNRMESNDQLVENNAYRNAYRSLAHELVYMANHFGQQTTAGVRVDVPLTHQDLSELLNLSRETVSREMVKLKSKGLVTNDHRIVIPDLAALRAVYL